MRTILYHCVFKLPFITAIKTYTLDLICPVKTEKVRVGGERDSGYVLHKSAVSATRLLLSFGVGGDWRFERDFLEKNPELKVESYDPFWSPSAWCWCHTRLKSLGRTVFGRKGTLMQIDYLRDVSKYRAFLRKSGTIHHSVGVSDRVYRKGLFLKFTDIATIFAKIPADLPVFIKMDVEGDEFLSLEHVLPYVKQITGVAVEFHGLARVEVQKKFVKILRAFREADMHIVHANGNNYEGYTMDCTGKSDDVLPQVLELTFAPRRLLGEGPLSLDTRMYPLDGLDFPNRVCEEVPQPQLKIDFTRVKQVQIP